MNARSSSAIVLSAAVVLACVALGGWVLGSCARLEMSAELERERALRVEAEEARDRWASDAITHRVRAIDWQLCSQGEQDACEKAREDEERRRSSGASWERF